MMLLKSKNRNSNTCRIRSFGLGVIVCFLLFSNSRITAQNQFPPRISLTEPTNVQSGQASSTNNSSSVFSQMPMPPIPRSGSGTSDQTSGKLFAVIHESKPTNQQPTHQNPTHQQLREHQPSNYQPAEQETSSVPPTFNLKTKSLSPNIVEASRRAINNANRNTLATNQNTNTGSGWGIDPQSKTANHRPVHPSIATQNSNGQNTAEHAVAYSQVRQSTSPPVRMASMTNDLPPLENSNSIRNGSAAIDSSHLLNVEPNFRDNETADATRPNALDEKVQASGTIGAEPLPTDATKQSGHDSGNKINLTDTIQKVALSTVVILVLCVVSIVILKKLGFTGPVQKKKTEPEFDVIETKRISGKCQLQLVTIRNHKVIVGIDQSGIKSMVCLPPSFADEFDEANSSDTSLEEANAEAETRQNTLNDSSSIADLLATDAAGLYESAKRKSTAGASATSASAARETYVRDSNLATRIDSKHGTIGNSEASVDAQPHQPTRRRAPIRHFHSYEIAGGGNSGE